MNSSALLNNLHTVLTSPSRRRLAEETVVMGHRRPQSRKTRGGRRGRDLDSYEDEDDEDDLSEDYSERDSRRMGVKGTRMKVGGGERGGRW